MRRVQSEYAMKGLFLGILLYTAMQIQIQSMAEAALDPAGGEETRFAWALTGRVGIYMLAGLGAALGIGLIRQMRDIAQIVKKPHAALLFLLLENPFLIYVGLIGGLALGAGREFEPGDGRPSLIILAVGGAILGYGFGELRNVADLRYRLGIAIAVGAAVIYALVLYLEDFSGGLLIVRDSVQRHMLGSLILLGLPFYYLLCFAGIAEESEAEIAGLCTMLGFAIYMLQFPKNMPAAGFVLPAALYFTYVTYVLPGLRVFKHTLRGYAYMEIGKTRLALLAFRRALQLDPANSLAQHGMDAMHTNIEVNRLDARTIDLLDPERCLNRVRSLLLRKPTAEEMHKALHILDLIEKVWPKMVSAVLYFQAVAKIHQGQLDAACALLDDLLNPEGWYADDQARRAILFEAWQLALIVHPVIKRSVGEPQLALPGRRMDAICAVERKLAASPNDAGLLEFRNLLYADLKEREYGDVAAAGLPADFNHRYCEELGMQMIGNASQWERGAAFLRMAANGLSLRRPSIYHRLASAYAQAGDTVQATRSLMAVRDAGLEVGLDNLPADQKTIYFTTVKRLAEEAAARNEIDEAIYDYSLATHAPDSGVPTLRVLAEMHEKKGDVMNALRITEKALCYDGRDPDLLKNKDRYYYSLGIDVLAQAVKTDDNVRKFFDLNYCVKKAKSVLDAKNSDVDTLDWAQHLVGLALVMQPKNLIAMVQKARLHLRRGERNEALPILEDVREMKPDGVDQTEAWYFVHKQLGKLYLDELNRPDLAIGCFQEYLNHVGSGAETLFDLGRAYEATGDRSSAISNYNQVTAYEGHPLYWEAQQAVRRLKEKTNVSST